MSEDFDIGGQAVEICDMCHELFVHCSCEDGGGGNVVSLAENTVAAKWWADRLRHGAKMQMTTRDQTTQETDMSEILARMNSDSERRRLSKQQIDKFEHALADIIYKRFMDDDGWERSKDDPQLGSYHRTIGVDYGPCSELRTAYEAAGGSPHITVFPMKTMMWVNPGSVTVRYGYGAEIEELMGHD